MSENGTYQLDNSGESRRYLIAQLGARRHYAVPRILHESGMLAHLYTDVCATKGWPRLLRGLPAASLPRALRRLSGRIPTGVPPESITAFSIFGMRYAWERARARNQSERTAAYLWAGREFCRLVLKAGFDNASGVYTFNGAGLELLTTARLRGLHCVMEQTSAPRRIEHELLLEEHRRFPGWEEEQGMDALDEATVAREEREWDQADTILCGSEFVREGIRQAGGPMGRCRIVPYGLDMPVRTIHRIQHNGPLRVLTVGRIALLKGSQYVLEAAKQMGSAAVFRMVGYSAVLPKAEAMLREHVELTGPIPRSEMAEQFAWADVFLLPSLCEGSAMVTYEAMSYGLPVVCTPNAGSQVIDGESGFIVPPRDVDAIVIALEACNRDVRGERSLGLAASKLSAGFDVSSYGRRIESALNSCEELG